MKKGSKIAALGIGACAGAVYMGALTAFLVFFRRNPREEREFEDFYALLEHGDYGEWVPRIKAAREWLGKLPHEDVYIRGVEGVQLHGRFFENPHPNGRTVIFSHGYRSSCEQDFVLILSDYWEEGYHMLLPDQRAHGESDGQYICFGTKEHRDIEAWCRYVRERLGRDARYVLHGMSMGATSVLLAASLPGVQKNLLGVVADSGFTSPYNQFLHVTKEQLHVPRFLLPVVEGICGHRAGFRFREVSTEDALSKVKVPILFIHGEGDRFVPCENSKKNYEACVSPSKWLLTVPLAGHGRGYYQATEEWKNALRTFWNSFA